MKLTLFVWRQANAEAEGRFKEYRLDGLDPNMSFLEMLDVLNQRLSSEDKPLVAFDSDCREGICGTCSIVINGMPHGPQKATTVCELYLRHFQDGQELYLEPWRARAFPIVKDLVVNRSAFDRIIMSGGYVSVNTGSAPDANALPVAKEDAETSLDAAACIGCGACVAACKNASAMLFVSAQIARFIYLPQGKTEHRNRVLDMVEQMDAEGFGNCTNYYECEAVCPKEIPVRFIAELNREFLRASFSSAHTE